MLICKFKPNTADLIFYSPKCSLCGQSGDSPGENKASTFNEMMMMMMMMDTDKYVVVVVDDRPPRLTHRAVLCSEENRNPSHIPDHSAAVRAETQDKLQPRSFLQPRARGEYCDSKAPETDF